MINSPFGFLQRTAGVVSPDHGRCGYLLTSVVALHEAGARDHFRAAAIRQLSAAFLDIARHRRDRHFADHPERITRCRRFSFMS